ncbi:MAG: hypothetical protein HUU50_00130 [Candidatus Brocadiae bacterium]|nr:hypothetical protein [Candidatus Brocadiia bacterium]
MATIQCCLGNRALFVTDRDLISICLIHEVNRWSTCTITLSNEFFLEEEKDVIIKLDNNIIFQGFIINITEEISLLHQGKTIVAVDPLYFLSLTPLSVHYRGKNIHSVLEELLGIFHLEMDIQVQNQKLLELQSIQFLQTYKTSYDFLKYLAEQSGFFFEYTASSKKVSIWDTNSFLCQKEIAIDPQYILLLKHQESHLPQNFVPISSAIGYHPVLQKQEIRKVQSAFPYQKYWNASSTKEILDIYQRNTIDRLKKVFQGTSIFIDYFPDDLQLGQKVNVLSGLNYREFINLGFSLYWNQNLSVKAIFITGQWDDLTNWEQHCLKKIQLAKLMPLETIQKKRLQNLKDLLLANLENSYQKVVHEDTKNSIRFMIGKVKEKGITKSDDDPLHFVDWVKVELLCADRRTVFARVLRPFAGKEDLYTWFPEKETEVLLAFPDHFESMPIVLGTLTHHQSSSLEKAQKIEERQLLFQLGQIEIFLCPSGELSISLKKNNKKSMELSLLQKEEDQNFSLVLRNGNSTISFMLDSVTKNAIIESEKCKIEISDQGNGIFKVQAGKVDILAEEIHIEASKNSNIGIPNGVSLVFSNNQAEFKKS